MQATPEKLPYKQLTADQRREKVRANRARIAAFGQRLVVIKSARYVHRALPHGLYHLVALGTPRKVATATDLFTIDELESLLATGELSMAGGLELSAFWPGSKRCSKCRAVKPLDDFYRNSSSWDGHQYLCKPCANAKDAAYHLANRDRLNEKSKRNQRKKRAADPNYTARGHLWTMFRMRLEDYEAKFQEQGGVCAICGSPPGKKRLAVDHDHACCPSARSCGQCIRGLLCSPCNTGAGIADKPDLLRRRGEYVEEWQRRLTVTQVA